MMKIQIETSGGVRIIKLIGKLNIESSDRLQKTIASLLEKKPSELQLDLSELSHMDSSGLGILIRTANESKAAGTKFLLVNPTEDVIEIIKMCCPINFFDIKR